MKNLNIFSKNEMFIIKKLIELQERVERLENE